MYTTGHNTGETDVARRNVEGMNKFRYIAVVSLCALFILGMMKFCSVVLLGLFVVIVILTTLAEIVHAFRLRSVKTLMNIYTFGYILAIVIGYLRATGNLLGFNPSFFIVGFYLSLVDCAAMYLLGAYAFIRGGHLVFDLFGKGQSYEIRCPMQGRLDMCRYIAWTLGLLVIIRIGPFVVIWLLDLFEH